MKTLEIEKLHIIAQENIFGEPVSRIYVVKKELDGLYDDPSTCVVEFDSRFVYPLQPLHQFYKFCYPVDVTLNEMEMKEIMKGFLSYSITSVY